MGNNEEYKYRHDIWLFNNNGILLWEGELEKCPYPHNAYDIIYVRFDPKNYKYLTEAKLKPEYEIDYDEKEVN